MDIKEAYQSFLSGEEQALEFIVEKYKDPLIFFVFRFVQNIADAEDIVEDVFFKLAVRKPKYRDSGKFSTWLFAIARNESVSFLRKKKRFSPDNIDNYPEISGDDNEVEKLFLKEEISRQVNFALNRLPDAYREVIHLSFFCDMKNGEIARITKRSKKQVENLLFRAKAALKKELEKEGFDYENCL